MPRIVTAVAATTTAIVLLFSYHTSTNKASATTSAVATASGSSGTSTTTDSGSSSGSSGSSSSSSSSSSTRTVTGDVAQTRWGPVQVQLTISGGRITAAQAVQVPSGNMRDQEINDQAVPVLNQEVVSAQSADIDTVSGATVTSDGYLQSLQSAIDAAHL